jgi:hypothetical protein
MGVMSMDPPTQSTVLLFMDRWLVYGTPSLVCTSVNSSDSLTEALQSRTRWSGMMNSGFVPKYKHFEISWRFFFHPFQACRDNSESLILFDRISSCCLGCIDIRMPNKPRSCLWNLRGEKALKIARMQKL